MNTFAPILLALLLCSCAHPFKAPKNNVVIKNGCMIDAIEFQDALQVHELLQNKVAWSKILIVSFHESGISKGHAYCVYLYPTGRNTLWARDRERGSIRIRAYRDQPLQIARKLIPNTTAAFYLDEEPTLL